MHAMFHKHYKDACIKANYQHVLDLFDLCIVAPSAAQTTDHFSSIQFCLQPPPPSSSAILESCCHHFSLQISSPSILWSPLPLWPCGFHCKACLAAYVHVTLEAAVLSS